MVDKASKLVKKENIQIAGKKKSGSGRLLKARKYSRSKEEKGQCKTTDRKAVSRKNKKKDDEVDQKKKKYWYIYQ